MQTQTIQACASMLHTFTRPRLHAWSVDRTSREAPQLVDGARDDYARDLRIKALGMLLCSLAATPLWRRVCKDEMYREIRARSDDQRIAMELAILEATR